MMMYMMRDNQVITSTDDPIVKYAPLFEVCLMKAPRSVNERIYTNTMAAAQSIQLRAHYIHANGDTIERYST
jgi:hypothetical protein